MMTIQVSDTFFYDLEKEKNEAYNQALEDVMKIYNEMQPKLATNVYEFGERIKALNK